ncbi:MAG: hypothetical protein WCF18_05905 [Chthoniobacteraceae bacterium]
MKRNTKQGNILIVALVLVFVISGFVATALNVTNNSARFTDRSRNYAAAQSAAEGAVEYAFGVWKTRILAADRALSTTAANSGLTAPQFNGVSYATANGGSLRIDALDEYGAPMPSSSDVPAPVATDIVSYPGWRGFTYNYLAKAKFQQTSGAYNFNVGVKRQFQYSAVPLFQSMLFFEHDLAIYKAQKMNVTGLVHTNSNAYISSSSGNPVSFADNVSYAGNYSQTNDPPLANTWSGWTANAELPPTYPNGFANQVHQVPRIEPIGTDPSLVINTSDANPNNDSLREIIEPPNSSYTDPPAIAQRRYYNKAGIVMNINGSTITVTTQNGTSLSAARVTDLQNAVVSRTTIYDQREGKNVDVATLDMSKVTAALSATGVSGFNNTLYVHDTTPLTTGNTEPKAVRLSKGGVLPANGLTVASENPVYVQGDYNTGTTSDPNAVPSNNGGNSSNTDSPTVNGYTRKPAAVVADAVMLLSNNWSDANANQTLSSRHATNTTFNMAILAGFMPSGYQPAVGAQYGYSGGAINFPRFLEDWSGDSCTYFGSMVELFQSKIFTGEWDTGVIYRPPDRQYNFDTNYRSVPPPGSLNAASWSRGSWAKF